MKLTLENLLFLVFGVLSPWLLQADPSWPVVVGVTKKVKLSSLEKSHMDYFVRGGLKNGLVQGGLVSVVRKVPVYDALEAQSLGPFYIKVANVEIVQASEDKSVVRYVTGSRPQESPTLNYNNVMIGDFLDMKTLKRVSLHESKKSLPSPSPKNRDSLFPQKVTVSDKTVAGLKGKDSKSSEPVLLSTPVLRLDPFPSGVDMGLDPALEKL